MIFGIYDVVGGALSGAFDEEALIMASAGTVPAAPPQGGVYFDPEKH
ncbi:MAG: hypothetical protein LUD43_03150 [Firmicutes bacterium]|nr:hypothetical protein [Bacillota bacterium]